MARSNKDPQQLLMAGIEAAQAGDLTRAGKHLTLARKLAPRDPNIPFNLGHVALQQGAFREALRMFQQVRTLDARYPEVDYSLAEALVGLRNYQEALEAADRAVKEAPADIDARVLKARCEVRLERHEAAIETLTSIIAMAPGRLDARLMLGELYSKRFLTSQVVEQLQQVLAAPNLPLEALIRIGDIYGQCGLSDEAAVVAVRALEMAPNSPVALTFDATVNIDLGNFDAAEAGFRKVLALDPANTLAYQGLADIKRLTEDDREALEAQFQSKTATSDQKTQSGFALYYLNNKAKRHDEAFEALSTANRMMRERSPQNVSAAQAGLLRLREIITPDFLADRKAQGYDRAGPVFIVGMPRSGTTLTEQLLAGHPSVHAGGERTDVTEIRRTIASFPDGITDLDADWARQAGETVYNAMFAEAGDCTFATDKLPGNYAFAGFIRWILPQSKFIYCHRNPQANALSLFEQHFSSLPFSRDLRDIAIAYNAHTKIVRHWREECAIEMFDLDYDALVADPEPIAERMYAFLGLDWDPGYLDITKVVRPVSTASRWQARQPINTQSVERWRHYEEHLKPFTEALEIE